MAQTPEEKRHYREHGRGVPFTWCERCNEEAKPVKAKGASTPAKDEGPKNCRVILRFWSPLEKSPNYEAADDDSQVLHGYTLKEAKRLFKQLADNLPEHNDRRIELVLEQQQKKGWKALEAWEYSHKEDKWWQFDGKDWWEA